MTTDTSNSVAGSRGWNRYPPAYAPLSPGAIAGAALRTPRSDPAAELEAHLCERYRAERVVLYASGTDALTAAISAAMAGRPRIVALPAYNCYDVATAAIGADARLLFYDIDPATLAPDPDSLNAAFAAGASTAVVAPLYGYPIDWELVEGVAAPHGATVIEDAAQGIGGSWRGSPLGSLGRISILSFGRGKGWTGGGGGAVLLRGTDVRPAPGRRPPAGSGPKAVVLAAAQWLLSDPRVFAIPAAIPWLHLGETRFREPSEPRAQTPFSSALVLATADAAIRESASRAAAAHEMERQLTGLHGVDVIPVAINGAAGYLRLPVRIRSEAVRSRILRDFGRLGVAPGYPGRVPDLDAVASRLAGSVPRCPGAAALVREIVTLPTHSHADRNTVAVVRSALS